MSSLIRPPWRVVRRVFSSLPRRVVDADSCGIPRRPTWSVNELLESYPSPTLAPQTLKHLHDLAALVPPKENMPEHTQLKTGLEELIRLVEAVKMVDTENVSPFQLEDPGKQTQDSASNVHELTSDGRVLLKHATRTRGGFYVIDTNRIQ